MRHEEAPGDDELDRDVETRVVDVPPGGHGQRLDRWLAARVPEFSRTYLQTLIEAGHVRIDDRPARGCARRLQAAQRVAVELVPTAASRAFVPEAMPLAIVHEDADLLVVDKPAGLVVHPAAGNWSGTLLNGVLAHHPGAASLPRAGIVHRLDKDTSGLMVVAKTLEAATALVRALAARKVSRRYLALAHGEVPWPAMTIDAPIGRDPASRLRMAVLAGGKPARTDVQRLAVRDGISALRCALHTGRTHQIRVHLASRGHPLLADALYGGRPALGLARQALHAAELRFAHPRSGAPMAFAAPPPADFAVAWACVTGPARR